MIKRRKPLDDEQRAKMLAELRRDADIRQHGFRERALALFPHVCARCGREFSGKRLRELTVHHRDHNHNNNPPDGGNWELLCIYCHDHEHEKYRMAGHGSSTDYSLSPSIFKPFEGMDALLGGAGSGPKKDDT